MTQRVVINKKYGGFSLSRKAVARMAELQGRPCYFFTNKRDGSGNLDLHGYAPISEDEDAFMWFAFDIPNPDEVLRYSKPWHEMTDEERRVHNDLYDNRKIDSRPDDRADPLLIQVVTELGKEANGDCASLEIVEVPDGVDWQIEEYDGMEWVAEKHKTWG